MDSLAVPRVNATNFVALALVINRVRDGPTFVFHYPPHVNAVAANDASDPGGAAGMYTPTEALDHGDIILERLSGGGTLEGSGIGSRNAQAPADGNSQCVPWDTVAGFPTKDLASILTPGRPYHKKLFQLSLDPLCCVSYPIHVPEGGKWKRKKKPHKPKSASQPCNDDGSGDQELAPGNGCRGGVAQEQRQDRDRVESDTISALQDGPRDGQNRVNNSGCRDEAAKLQANNVGHVDNAPEDKQDKPSSMNMFNLVFILNPRKHEVNELVETLYLNIVKKVNKALKYSQGHSDFVWKESKKILAMKEKGREERRRMSSLWKDIVVASSLASSIQEIYDAVSQNKIATLQLETQNGALTPSVQIPIPFSVADLPLEGHDEPHHRGLWLTTANTFVEEDAINEPSFLDKNFALLLMDDEKNIMSELQVGVEPSAQSMVEFVRLSKPTVSFHKVGQNASLTLGQVRRFAQHFIFWRRAIAIPPLHARDVYILSPNCNMSQLPRASAQWQRNFSHVPSLPNLLAEISYAPRPFKHFAPTKAHRPLYLHMLAWLMRGGWVTQLCTFAYVVVWPEIVYEVEYQAEAEELRRSAELQPTAQPADPTAFSAMPLPSDTYSGHAGCHDYHNQTSPQLGADIPNVPTMMEQAAEQARLDRIADKAKREAAEKATAHARKTAPRATENPSLNTAPHLARISPYIIIDPRRAAGRESLYLSAIARRLKDDKAVATWSRFLKYFNGQCALERIALQEELKRKEAWALLGIMSEYLLCVRHW